MPTNRFARPFTAFLAVSLLAAPAAAADPLFLPVPDPANAQNFKPVSQDRPGAIRQDFPDPRDGFFLVERIGARAKRYRIHSGPSTAALAPTPPPVVIRRFERATAALVPVAMRPQDRPLGLVDHAWPVDAREPYRVSSPFGWRADPFTGARAFHAGVDIAVRAGTPALATAPGVIHAIGEHPRLGRYVMVAHRDGSIATYGHLEAIAVGTGDRVERGNLVGRVGATGRATGPHLDFGLEVAGQRVDPLPLLQRPPTR